MLGSIFTSLAIMARISYNTSLAASKAKLAAAKKSANFNGDPYDRDPIVAAAQRL